MRRPPSALVVPVLAFAGTLAATTALQAGAQPSRGGTTAPVRAAVAQDVTASGDWDPAPRPAAARRAAAPPAPRLGAVPPLPRPLAAPRRVAPAVPAPVRAAPAPVRAVPAPAPAPRAPAPAGTRRPRAEAGAARPRGDPRADVRQLRQRPRVR